MPTKAKAKGSRFWRKLRIYFRRARITVWLVVLAVLGALIYLNLIGLPGFLKRPLLARLAERGLALEFDTLRLHWSRGFIAEHVRFGASSITNNPAVPRFTAREVEFNLHLRALLLADFQVDSLALRNGTLIWTLPATNAPERQLAIEHIESSIRLAPNDCWVVDDFRARFGGADFFVRGSLANASALREMVATEATSAWPRRLRILAETLDQIQFATPPVFRLELNGDARDLRSFDARFSIKAAAADTAWGRGQNLLLLTRLLPTSSNELSRAEINLTAARAETPWATTTNLELKLRLVTPALHSDQVEVAGTLLADEVESPWAMVTGLQLKSSWTQAITNPIPRAARLEGNAHRVSAYLTHASEVDFSAALNCLTNPIAPAAELAFWNQLLPYAAQWTVSVGRWRSVVLPADQITVAGEWSPPQLALTRMDAQLYQGTFTGTANLDVVSREFHAGGAGDFELRHLFSLLPRADQERLQDFTWATPPRWSCAAALTLPPWNEPPNDWAQALRPTLRLAGEVAVTNGTYRGVHADWVTTHFTYTNSTWDLPDLTLSRPEGGLRLHHRADESTGQYYFQLHSTIAPQAIVPLLDPGVRRGLDLCEFGQPPDLAGELWGNWSDPASIGFQGRVALTNFAFRGQPFGTIVSGLRYTNLAVELFAPRVWSGTQHISADGIRVDFNTHRTHFTNGFGCFDPKVIVHAIGPMVARVMAPYHFLTPPTARFHGYVPMGNPHDADVVFEGGGAAFESLKFHATHYTAKVIWKNNLLTVTNTSGDFYGGRAAGWAHFDFPNLDHAQYMFAVEVAGARLPALLADVTGKTNNVDGLLTGQLVVTNAWTDNLKSWHGYGQATLRDGLLWALPVFGVLSGPLDAIMPGIGNSRFTEAKGTFNIANSIIYSPDLEMRSAAMRLQYRGAVDFDGNLNARIIAEPLRDTPVVGPVVSSILSPVARLFAYRITGTMKDPKSEPIYIPGPMMYLFSPFQSLGELFSPGPAPAKAREQTP